MALVSSDRDYFMTLGVVALMYSPPWSTLATVHVVCRTLAAAPAAAPGLSSSPSGGRLIEQSGLIVAAIA